MKKFNGLKVLEIGLAVGSAVIMVANSVVGGKKQEKLIDEAVAKRLAEKQK